ncbi:hypothetical protein [Alkalilacustris brevis]|uniref:hypothetical protein n=1 Tax=Alkalilacustris brevis TaxID=2026338 RepID=UPI000E0D8625|nr:hypothetical protein [Alkalilacustris brevis]
MPDFRALTRRLIALLLLPVLVAACAPAGEWAADDVVARARHVSDAPAEITLITVINTRSGAGDHSALIINGEHRILYDPAGSWFNRHAPRRNDVHYGMSPQLERIYLDYHARDTHHVIAQTLRLTPGQAAAAIQAAKAQSAAPSGQCAVRTSAVLRQIPGLEGVGSTFFPRTLKNRFEDVPGVVTRRIDAPVLPPRESAQTALAG